MAVGEFPYDDPVRCLGCGYVTERRRLADQDHRRRSLAGIRHVAPGDCEPDEYVAVCPECGAVEAFDEAARCAECLEYPCICTPPAAEAGI